MWRWRRLLAGTSGLALKLSSVRGDACGAAKFLMEDCGGGPGSWRLGCAVAPAPHRDQLIDHIHE